MKLYSLKEMSKLWGLSDGLLRRYCRDGRIPSAVLEDGSWWIPEGTEKPKGTYKKAPAPVLTSLAKRIIYEHSKNNHHGIYEYIQVNLAYSSCRMASNRLTRKQVIEVYRTDKISSAFEPMKVDDLIEMINHFICMRHVIDTLTEPLTQSYIKRLHVLLTYGTYADRKHKIGTGEYRTKAASIGKMLACPPKDINKALGDLINEYEETKTSCTIERILDFHVRFERIRPFDDYAEYAAKAARAEADYLEAQKKYETVKRGLHEKSSQMAAIRKDFVAAVNDHFAEDPAKMDMAALALMDSGIMKPNEYAKLMEGAEKAGNYTMIRMIAARAGAMVDKATTNEAASIYKALALRGRSVDGSDYIRAFDGVVSLFDRCLKNPSLYNSWDKLVQPVRDAM